jgi:hypothetical protein
MRDFTAASRFRDETIILSASPCDVDRRSVSSTRSLAALAFA